MTAGSALIPPLKMVVLSDVSVGYGSPQVLRMAISFAERFGVQVHILEPDEPERAPVDIREFAPGLPVTLERIYTSAHPYWMQGRIEYCRQAAERVNRLAPDILLFATMYGIEVLDHIYNSARMLTILYCLEEVDLHYEYLFPLVVGCDIRIYPEENRRRLYSERLSLAGDRDSLVIYNTNGFSAFTPVEGRNGHIVHAGTFSKTDTLASYFLNDEISQLPIDIYGIFRGFDDDGATEAKLKASTAGLRFRGYVRTDQSFFDTLSTYLYSIVIWNPDREDRFYAAPNKLFDAIACGVPPICAPHPQCIEIINKWRCGILMNDWTYGSFRGRLMSAFAAAGSDYYRELVDNCRRAAREELSWSRQFEKVVPLFERHLALKTKVAAK